jgi:nucleoside-diphosphate-sugar epimerase
MTSCLVLGAGQVGTFAARALAERDASVVAADRSPDQDFFARFGPVDGAPLLTADIGDLAALRSVMIDRRAEIAILTAGIAGSACANAPHSAWRVNVEGTATVARAAIQAGVRCLVFISSFAVYGRPRLDRLSETVPLQPRSVYGQSKVAAEQVLGTARAAGLHILILRPCGIYGPRLPHGGSHSARFVESALRQGLRGRDLVIRAAQTTADEYLYVKDLGRAIALLALSDTSSPQFVFNVGPGKTTNAQDFSDALRKVVPRARVQIEDVGAGEVHLRPPLDVSRVRKAFGFSPAFDLIGGLSDYLREIGREG